MSLFPFSWRIKVKRSIADRIILVLFVLLLGSPLIAAEPRIHRGLAYAEPKNERQMLDVYAPTEGKNHPVVIWIHGGGWSAGDKKEVYRKPQAFADQGFVLVSINYRFQPIVTIKQIAGDVAKAIRWVHDHAHDYGGDPARIVVMGHSAGGQLAALVCTDESYLKAEGLSFSNIKGCVPVDGRFRMGQNREDLSPATHVGEGKNIPPFLILFAAKTPEEPQRFAKSLQAAGISAKAYPAEGKNHSSIHEDLGLPGDSSTQEMFEFLAVVMKK